MKKKKKTITFSPTQLRIKRDDTVRVLLGKDRGKSGKVLAVLPKEERVIVEGINVVQKHVKPRQSGKSGQRVSMPAPLGIAKVQLVCPHCKKGVRVGITRENDERQRVCKKCKEIIG